MPIGKSRGLDWKEAVELDQWDYILFKEYIDEPAILTGILDFKYWSKFPGLFCCFTLDNGDKIKACAFRFKDESGYGPRDEQIDFSEIGIEGKRYRLVFDIGKRSKKLCWRSAISL